MSDRQSVEVGVNYVNTKTQVVYTLIALGTHTETGEAMACYMSASPNPMSELWIRPLFMFAGKRDDGRWYFEKEVPNAV